MSKLPQFAEVPSRIQRLLEQADPGALPRWKTALLSGLRIGYGVLRDLGGDQLTLRAMSLVYTTLLSLVPLLAISFSVLKGFGVHNQIEPFLLNLLAPLGERAGEITERIVEFVDNTRVGVLGFVGFALLFYTVVSLIQKIERAFNHVWHVGEERSFLQRFRDYLSVVVIGPVLIFSSLGIMASLTAAPVVERLAAIEPLGWIIEVIGRLIPTLMVIAAFTFIYIFVPNTRVQTRSALLGGAVAGVLWNGLGWLFAAFVATSAKYTAIYSGFATPIVFMIWLYLGWLVLLTGASIAFYHQNPEYVLGKDGGAVVGNRLRERIALLAMAAIGRNFYAGGPAIEAATLAERLRIPMQALAPVLDAMRRAGLLQTTDDEPPRLIPAVPPEATPLASILKAVRGESHGRSGPAVEPAANAAVEGIVDRLERAIEGSLEDATWKDLALREAAAVVSEKGRDIRSVQ